MKFRAATPGLVNAFAALLDADEVRQLGGNTGPYLFHSRSKSVTALIALLAGRNETVYVHADHILHTTAVPNDPSYPNLWALHNTTTPGADISAQSAWDISSGSTANVVGVVDTGIDYNHPDLAANVWSAPAAFTVHLSFGNITCAAGTHGYNAITRSCNPLDDNNHGTHVSGTIGAVGNNGVGVTGVNWQTRIIGLKFMNSQGSGSSSDAIDAIEFAIQTKAAFAGTATPVNIRVLSNSWGGAGNDTALLDEINRANTSDMLFVCAAGNSSSNNDLVPFYPASYNASNLIAVAATDINDNLASFSNYGRNTVHLAAPGVSILSTVRGGGYAYSSGTSMSTPHVSGAAALVLSACTLNTAGLKTTLLNNVDLKASLTSVTISGGRLNVNAAMRACAPPPASTTSIWSGAAVPAGSWANDNPVTLGVKFRSDVAGSITGIRFYKSSGNTGTHIGLLYGSGGALLGQVTFNGETASGWQQMNFASAVSIAANTTYVAALYSTSGYTADFYYFSGTGVNNAPLHALQNGVDGGNGVYAYGGSPQYPGNSYAAANYWVDVAFSTANAPPPPPPPPPPASATSIWSGATVPGGSWANDSPVTLGVKFRSDVSGSITGIRFYKSSGNTGTHVGMLYSSGGTLLGQATFSGETASGWQQMNFASAVSIAANTTYVAALYSTSGYTADFYYFSGTGVNNAPLHALQNGVDGGNGVYAYGGSPQYPGNSYASANYWVDVAFSTANAPLPPPPPASTTSIWSGATVPGGSWANDNPVTLGVKFRSDVSGSITGIRFYKSSGNTGTHVGLLYSSGGTLLGQVTFSGESASGWQQMNFASPVSISANTTYVAALYSTSGYTADFYYFSGTGVNNAPLHALQNGVDGGNGVYAYGGSPQYPGNSYASANYWVDVAFTAQ